MSTEKHFVRDYVAVDTAVKPVVIIGTGPVGMRCAQELLKREENLHIFMYGAEPWTPYDRVALSSVLSGDLDWSSIETDIPERHRDRITRFDNCPIRKIDRERKVVVDCEHNQQPYSRLIIATGSSPHVPSVPGIHKKGVYTFRNKTDLEHLMARRTRSRTTVIIGGGLLGIEAARAMRKQNTEVIIIEHSSRLMANQLDTDSASILRERVLSQGIKVVLNDGVKKVIGEPSVNGIQLHSGKIIHCDTIIVSTGIKPNTSLAKETGLSINKGIRVNDYMQTSDSNIYAIGECAEHRGKIYGIVAPGLEQSAVAAHSITGGSSTYRGSLNATKLKVADEHVFSCGEPDTEQDRPALRRNYVYRDDSKHIYRKIVVENSRIIGVISIGKSAEAPRLQQSVENRQRLWPWQILRFRKTGLLYAQSTNQSVASWPAGSVVCSCKNVTRGQLTDEIDAGCTSVTGLMKCTGASTVCGSCRPLLSELMGESVIENKAGLTKPLITASLFSLFAVIAFVLLTPIAYTTSTQYEFAYDTLWRDGLFRQISGFTLLGITVLLMLLPLRKRLKKFTFGSYVNWRLIHAVLGSIVILTLIAHTGLRLGENLNMMLITTYLTILVLGGLAGASAHLEGLIGAKTGKQVRSIANKLHLYAFWPAPALLTFHVISVYYF